MRSETKVMNTKKLTGPPQEESTVSIQHWRGKEKVIEYDKRTGKP